MNQILVIENKKKNKVKGAKAEITSVVRFFAIVIIAFGIFLISKGSYAMYQDKIGKNTENMPVVEINRVNDTVILTVNSKNKISYLRYSWNNGEETAVPIDGTYAEETIILPSENSVLNISVEEEKGRAVKYAKQFLVEGMDISKPNIEISEENKSNIKITATDDTQMAYITYKINDKEEIRIDKTESEGKKMNYILKLSRGENNLIITAVDNSGNIETVEKQIVVSSMPTMRYERAGKGINLIIEDQDGIKNVKMNINGQIYESKDINRKQLVVPLPLTNGTNTISVEVTNVNGLVARGVDELNYAS